MRTFARSVYIRNVLSYVNIACTRNAFITDACIRIISNKNAYIKSTWTGCACAKDINTKDTWIENAGTRNICIKDAITVKRLWLYLQLF